MLTFALSFSTPDEDCCDDTCCGGGGCSCGC